MNNQEMLTQELINASKAYYAGNPTMSDLEFDKKLEELRAMEQESGVVYPGSPTQEVGAEVVTELKKARHEQPALSLDKVKYKNREDLIKWLDRRQAVMMWKCDGSTVVLTYDDGKLTSAVTRGNGEEGSVITHNARYFKGVPAKIDYTGHLVVRGEAMMTNAEFERINAEAGGIYENARNLATATIQMLDANESRKREIIFKAFELVSPEPAETMELGNDDIYGPRLAKYMGDRLDWLEWLGFDVVDHEYVDSTDVLQKIEEWKEDVRNLPYPTDGLVISYNDLVEGWALGSTGHHPRWAMALKWTDETVETTIRDIEWSVGKTGVITPVAVFDPVRLGLGSTVTRASLHNLSIMENMPSMDGTGTCYCGKGSKARVYLANLIIPQIACCSEADWRLYGYNKEPSDCEDCRECMYHCADAHISVPCDTDEGCQCDPEPTIPEVCPVCGADLEVIESNGVKTLHCPNHDGCPAQQIGKLVNTFSKDGLDIKGLSEKKIEFLVNEGYVETALDFYRLKHQSCGCGIHKKRSVPGTLENEPGWDVKSVDNLLNAIDESRKTTLQKFLYSLNIPLLGNDLSKKLAKFWNNDIEEFKSFVKSFVGLYAEDDSRDDEAYAEGTYETAYRTLSGIDGVGEEKANNIIKWTEEVTAYREKYEDFVALIDELKFPEANPVSTDNSLEGLTFVITGSVNQYKNRDEFKVSVEARGGKVASSVSAKTTALVNNDVTSTSGKNQKAKELGIEIISEDEFISRYGK